MNQEQTDFLECTCGRIYQDPDQVEECKQTGHYFGIGYLRDLHRRIRALEGELRCVITGGEEDIQRVRETLDQEWLN